MLPLPHTWGATPWMVPSWATSTWPPCASTSGLMKRVHGIFTEAGEAANVVPRTSEAIWFVRSPTMVGLDRLVERVHTCLRAGAEAAGCDITIVPESHTFADMVDNPVLVERYVSHAAEVGRTVVGPTPELAVVGSTDMGNVSHLLPSIHPVIKVAPAHVAIHTAEFATHAASPEADRAVLDGATILALVAADCWQDQAVVQDAATAFARASERIP